MVGQPLQQRIFPEQSYQGTASHTVSTGESKQNLSLTVNRGILAIFITSKEIPESKTSVRLRQEIMESYCHSGFVLFRVLQIP